MWQGVLSFNQGHFDIVGVLTQIDQPLDLLAHLVLDPHLEEEVLLAVDVAHLIAELDFSEEAVFPKGLGLPLYLPPCLLFS